MQDDLVARGHVARGVPRDGTTRGPAALAGRAALRCTREPADGSGVEPRRRASRRGGDRTQPRAARRAAVGAVPPARGMARRAARPGMARGHPQRRPRLDLRVFGRRGVQRGAAPLRRGPPDRRRTHSPRRPRSRREPATARTRRAEPVGPDPQRSRHDHGRRRCGRRARTGDRATRWRAAAVEPARRERRRGAARRDRVDRATCTTSTSNAKTTVRWMSARTRSPGAPRLVTQPIEGADRRARCRRTRKRRSGTTCTSRRAP